MTEQIEWVLTYLRTSPMISTLSRKDALGRIDKPSYSEFALQEAVINALAHRDYEIAGAQVIVTLFPDRLEIRNPGGLHNSLTEENLYAGCQPVRRNQILAGFLRDYESPATGRRYMETRGEGFLTLVNRSIALSGRRPELVNMGGAVKLTLFAAGPDATADLLRSPANAAHLARSIDQYQQERHPETDRTAQLVLRIIH